MAVSDRCTVLRKGKYIGTVNKNQDFVVAVEHFEDFRALLHPNGDILHLCVGVDVQPVTLGQRQHLLFSTSRPPS